MKNLSILAIVLGMLGQPMSAHAGDDLDQKHADVTMNVGLFAKISGLDDFALSPVAKDGNAGAIYRGSDTYRLESNGHVRVSLSGSALKNGADEVVTVYELDNSGPHFDTAVGEKHNSEHIVSAEAELGDISEQIAGAYKSRITLTVSAL